MNKTEKRPINKITIENARLIFRDFTGERNRFNSDRTFGVVLDLDQADLLEDEGWNVKRLPPREEGDEPLCFLSVKVVFGKVPPKIVLINGKRRKQTLDPSTIGILDWVQIEKADLIIRPYNYDFAGHTGTKAYLSSMYVTKSTDTLEDKYADIPDEDEDMPWNEND